MYILCSPRQQSQWSTISASEQTQIFSLTEGRSKPRNWPKAVLQSAVSGRAWSHLEDLEVSMGGKICQDRDSKTNYHTPGNTQNIFKWFAEQLLLLLCTVRTQEPFYHLWSSCSTSFQLQPQCPTLICQTNHIGKQTPLWCFCISGQSLPGRIMWVKCSEALQLPKTFTSPALEKCTGFSRRSNSKVTSNWSRCEVWINGLLRPINQKQLLLVLSSHSNVVILWSRRHPDNLQSTFRHSLTSEELSSPLLKGLQEAHQPEVQRHSQTEAEEQL